MQSLHTNPHSMPRPRLRARLITTVCAAGLALVLGWRISAVPNLTHGIATSPILAPPSSAPESPQALRTETAIPSQPVRRIVQRDATAAVDVRQAEVCGYGTVQLLPDDPDPVQRIPLAVRESALAAVEVLMLASDSDQVRTAALWLGTRVGKRDTRWRIEQVARLAAGSHDPVVYAMGIEACKGLLSTDGGSCHLLSRARWAQLDPDNAVPWLELAAEARANNELELETTATRLASHARRSDAHEGLLPTLLDQALGQRATPLQRTLALSRSWSAQGAWTASQTVPKAVTRVDESAPIIGIDLSCDAVNRMQDWMRQRYAGS